MNEEEEESPLEDPRVRRNRLARERYAARSKSSVQRMLVYGKVKGHVVRSVN
jgi:hypothetical protein